MADHVLTALLIQSAPYAIACVLGIAIVIYHRASHRKVAAIVGSVLAIKLVSMVASLGFTNWVYSSVDAGADPATMGFYNGFVNVFLGLLNGFLWFALIVAAFTDRKPQREGVRSAA